MDNIKNDNYYVGQIISDIEKILTYTKDINYDEFLEDEQLVDAVLFRLIQMTENVKKLSPTFKSIHNGIEWNEIIGFRNKIVHEYGKTDYSIVYEVVNNDLKQLLNELKNC